MSNKKNDHLPDLFGGTRDFWTGQFNADLITCDNKIDCVDKIYWTSDATKYDRAMTVRPKFTQISFLSTTSVYKVKYDQNVACTWFDDNFSDMGFRAGSPSACKTLAARYVCEFSCDRKGKLEPLMLEQFLVQILQNYHLLQTALQKFSKVLSKIKAFAQITRRHTHLYVHLSCDIKT